MGFLRRLLGRETRSETPETTTSDPVEVEAEERERRADDHVDKAGSR